MNKKSLVLALIVFASLALLVFVNTGSMAGLVSVTGTVTIEINKVVPQAVCGNGAIEAGEQCESNSDCSAGQICVSCQCRQSVVPSGGGGGISGIPSEEAIEEEIIVDETIISYEGAGAGEIIEGLEISAEDLGFEEEIDLAQLSVERTVEITVKQAEEVRVEKVVEAIEEQIQAAVDEGAIEELEGIRDALNEGRIESIECEKTIQAFTITNNSTGQTVTRSRVVVTVKAAAEDRESVVVIDIIPKTVAGNVEELSFITQPAAILQADPIVKYAFDFIPKGEEKDISYVANREITKENIEAALTISVSAFKKGVSVEIERKATNKTRADIFNALNLGSFEGTASIELASEGIELKETVRVVEFVGANGEKRFETIFEIVLRNKGESVSDLLLVHLVPESILPDLVEIRCDKEFAIIGRELIAFKIPSLENGEAIMITFSIPKKLEAQELLFFEKAVLMVEKFDLVSACLVLYCDDSNPCTIDSCSKGACIHSNAENGAECGDGKICLSGECVESRAPGLLFVPRGPLAVSWNWILNLSLAALVVSCSILFFFERRKTIRAEKDVDVVEDAFVQGSLGEKEFVPLMKKLGKRRNTVYKRVKEKLFGKEI